MKTENQPTLSEKTTAMEKAIRMAKEVHDEAERSTTSASVYQGRTDQPISIPTPGTKQDQILTTAKQIYDWLLSE